MRAHSQVAAIGVLLCSTIGSLAASSVKVQQEGQGIYARADEASKFASLPSGTVMAVREEAGSWIRVAPPPSVACWIFADTVKDGRISSGMGRLRAAPNPTAVVLATLRRGDAVTVLSKEGEWVRVSPPANASVWVRRDSVVDTNESPSKAKPIPIPPPVAKIDPPKPVSPPPSPISLPPTPPAPVVAPEVKPKPAPVLPPPKGETPVVKSPPVPVVDPSKLTPKWTPPVEEEPVITVESLTSSTPVAQPPPPPVVKPVQSPKVVPSKAPADEPTRPKKKVEHTPVRPANPSPASGNTMVWPTSSSHSSLPAPTPVSTPSHAPTYSPPKKTTPTHTPVAVSTDGWESFNEAASAPKSRGIASRQSFALGSIHLPRRPYEANWNAPSSGTLLKRKVQTTRNVVSCVPAGVSEDRLRKDVFQGDRGCAWGILVKEEGGIRMRPSDYSLQILQGNGKSELIAYVIGSDAQLARFTGLKIHVEGTCWWLGDSAPALCPTVAPERLR